MRMNATIIAIIALTSNALAQGNIGINTTSPLARLHVADSGKGVLFIGPGGPAVTPVDPPVSGAGTRLMWLPDRVAFRVGQVTGNFWNKDSLGNYSFASGFDARATGIHAIAMGRFSAASGENSVAIGSGNATATGRFAIALGSNVKASGENSVALGHFSEASGGRSIAMGNDTRATGFGSTATGSSTEAYGFHSFAMGLLSKANGQQSVAAGIQSTANGHHSFAMGNNVTANARSMTVIGQFNKDPQVGSPFTWVLADPLFVVANGTDDANRSNALTILKNGKVGIGITNPAYTLHLVNNNAADGGFQEGLVVENINASTGEAAVAFRNAGPDGTGSKFWIVGLNQNRNLAFTYNNTFTTGTTTRMLLDSTGKLGLGTTAPVEKLDVVGNAALTGDLKLTTGVITRTPTGTANLVPVAYGSIGQNGEIYSGTGNFSIAISLVNSYRVYTFTIQGVTFDTETCITQVTPVSGYKYVGVGASAGKLTVQFLDYQGGPSSTGSRFHFVVYKP